MKVTGNAVLIAKKIKEKKNYYLKIREHKRDGEYIETELFCRLTPKAKEQLKIYKLKECFEIPISIRDSFYSVDTYFKGNDKYTKPTLVLNEFEN